MNLSKQVPLSDFTSLLLQRQFFTSLFGFGFWTGLLIMSLGRWVLLSKTVLGKAPVQILRYVCGEREIVPLVENNWTGLMAWFPTQAKL